MHRACLEINSIGSIEGNEMAPTFFVHIITVNNTPKNTYQWRLKFYAICL